MLGFGKSFAVVLAFTTLAVSNMALAADLQLPSGDYRPTDGLKSYRGIQLGQVTQFAIQKNGSTITLIDKMNNLTYNLDLNNSGEQSVPSAYLKYLRSRINTRVFGTIIRNISVSNIHQNGDHVSAKLNIYIGDDSRYFGTLNTSMEMGVTLRTTACKIDHVWNPKESDYRDYDKYNNMPSTCLLVETGTFLNVMTMETGLNPQINKAVGLVSDFVLKLFSPLFAREYALFSVPQI